MTAAETAQRLRTAIVGAAPPALRLASRALRARWNGEAELRLLPDLCRRDALSLDIGANLGVYTWHLARSSAGVVAFEPQAGMARFLRAAGGRRIRVEEVALSDVDGEAELRVPQEEMLSGRATIEPGNRLDDLQAEVQRVPMRRLDGFELPAVGFVKVDVEGHELAVLRGGVALLRRDAPSLIVEAEDRHRPRAVADLVGFLGDLGYRGFVMEAGRLRPITDFGGPDDIGARLAAVGVINLVFVARPEAVARLERG